MPKQVVPKTVAVSAKKIMQAEKALTQAAVALFRMIKNRSEVITVVQDAMYDID